MIRVQGMKRRVAGVLALLFIALAAVAQAEAIVGENIAMGDITGFCYTVDAPLAVSSYLRYRLYAEDGQWRLYHESRQGGAWPQTEEDVVASGTVALTDADREALYSCLRGGAVKRPGDDVIDGDDGPWMVLYWAGDGGEVREFTFASQEERAGFEALCSSLAGNHVLTRFSFSRGGDMVPRSCEIILRDGGCRIQDDDGESREFDAALAAGLRQVVEECGLEAWDGFHESDPDVLDGESFSMELGYADGSAVYASGQNAFPERYREAVDRIEAILEADRRSRIAGVYRYEGEGFGGDFTIALSADGSYSFSEGPLSSWQGGGTWSVIYDAVYMTGADGDDRSLMFGVEDGALVYVEAGSDGFPHVAVSDSERFVRQEETE